MAGIPPKYGKACMNLILVLVMVLGGILLIPKIMRLFMPFIIGGGLAWLANPLVNFLEQKFKVRRKTGTILVLTTIISGIVLVIYYVANRFLWKIAEVFQKLPAIWSDMQIELDGVIGELSMSSAGAVGSFAENVPGAIIGSVMCLLSAYFFVAEKECVIAFGKKRIPREWQKKCILLKQLTRDVIVGYLKAQLKIEFWVYLVIAVGLMLLRVQYGYLIAIPIAFLDFLPVFGTGTILIPWTILELLWGRYMYALGLIGIWGISQLVRQVIQPKVIGESMGMSPLPSLISLYVGYKLAGVAGMIAAIPLGILIVAMNQAGFFDNTKKSIVVLWHGFHKFRQFTEEEVRGSNRDETKL